MRGTDAVRQLRIDRFTALPAAIGALAGGLVLLRQVTYGVEVYSDSRIYIEPSRNLLEGNGLVYRHGRILVDAPPLFPLAPAGSGIFGVDAIEAAGYVNATAFGLTVFTTVLWLRSRAASRFLVVWAACACVLCVSPAHLSARALTDPLFILFAVLSLFALDGFMDKRRRSFLVVAAMSAALAWLTRYIGVTLVAGALLLLALHRGVPFSVRIKNAVSYAVIAGTPVGLWMLRNFLHTGAPLGKMHPSGFSLLSSLNTAGTEFSRWLFDGGVHSS